MLFRTLRLRLFVAPGSSNPYDRKCGKPVLFSVWHDSMVMPVFAGRQRHTTALTSQHNDGSFVASVLKWRKIPAVRGSTNRISTGSIRKLLEATATRHLVITPDGPRGPNRQMSMGIVYLASRSGRAVVPSAFVCSSCWRWKGSWSDLIIPKPFAKVVLMAAEPVFVPADLSTDELREYVDKVQQAMEQVDREARAKLGMLPSESSETAPRKAA